MGRGRSILKRDGSGPSTFLVIIIGILVRVTLAEKGTLTQNVCFQDARRRDAQVYATRVSCHLLWNFREVGLHKSCAGGREVEDYGKEPVHRFPDS